jgi:hypothetical protein
MCTKNLYRAIWRRVVATPEAPTRDRSALATRATKRSTRALWDTRAEGASRVKQDLLNRIDRGQANLQGPGKIVLYSAAALVAEV